MEIKRVGVIGCGLMGSGIAQVCATAGYPTVVVEVSQELCERGLAGISSRLDRLVSKGSMTVEERTAALSRLEATTSRERLASCDLIIEAVIENLHEKK